MGYGRLDGAVNNAAAYSGAFSFTADFTEQEFDETTAVSRGAAESRGRILKAWLRWEGLEAQTRQRRPSCGYAPMQRLT